MKFTVTYPENNSGYCQQNVIILPIVRIFSPKEENMSVANIGSGAGFQKKAMTHVVSTPTQFSRNTVQTSHINLC